MEDCWVLQTRSRTVLGTCCMRPPIHRTEVFMGTTRAFPRFPRQLVLPLSCQCVGHTQFLIHQVCSLQTWTRLRARQKADARRECDKPALCWVEGEVADECFKSLVSPK